MEYIAMPRLSDSMEAGTIVKWLVGDGTTIAAEQEIVEIETDKATMTYASEATGRISIIAAEGASIPVGEPIAAVGSAEGAIPPAESPKPARTEADSRTSSPDRDASASTAGGRAAPAATQAGRRAGRPVASPVARRLADANGIDLSSLTGSGPRGRITRSDVEAAIAAATPVNGSAPAEVEANEPCADRTSPPVQPLTRAQQIIARRMSDAKGSVPEFSLQADVDMEPALELRERLRQVDAPRLPSVNDLIVKACAIALRQHPRVNASYVNDEFHLHQQINIGVAVAAPDLLLVPTIRDADRKTLTAIAEETRALAQRVREGTASPADLDGGTFTISNLGMFGITAFTPILNPPQAAILGVGATREVLQMRERQTVVRRIMTLTLTCDHRILYGADGAAFLSDLRGILAEPLQLLL